MADTGVWIFGARGNVGTCVALGVRALVAGLATPAGMVTAAREFEALGLVDPGRLVLGGHECRSSTLAAEARRLADQGLFRAAVLETVAADLERIDERIVGAPALAGRSCGEMIEEVAAHLREFRRRHGLDRVVAVDLLPTEAQLPSEEVLRLRRSYDWFAAQPADSVSPGLLYMAGALRAGCAVVNFTPNAGTELGVLSDLADQRGLPHCGKDGKTGETLIKSVLAPMFVLRNLRILSWTGYNILGNADGRTLTEPGALAAKCRTKSNVLDSLLPEGWHARSQVRIDYVPSLDDWKTAWDHIHFEGFLGARMSLQFTWNGADSLLAAPLVLDLVRLCDHALRCGLSGALPHAASFFKSPIGTDEHDFRRQFELLVAYACEHATETQFREAVSI